MPPIDDNSGQFTEMLRITIDLSGFRAELDKALTVYKDFIADLGKVKAPTLGAMATPDLSKAIGEIKQTLASLSSDINTTVAGQFQVLGEQVERIYTTLGIQTTQAESKLTEVTRSASAERVAIVEEEAKKRAAAISQIVSKPIPPQQQAEEIRQTLTPQMQERLTAGQIEAVLVQGQAIKIEAESEAKTVEEAEAAKLSSREATARLVTDYLTQQATQTVSEAEAGVKITAEAEAQKAKLYEQTLQTVRRVLAEQNALMAEGGQVSAQRTAEALLQAVPAEAQANVTPKQVESVVVQASESTAAQETAAAKEKAVIQGTLAVTKDVNAQKVADSQQAAERVTAFILQQELIAKDGVSAAQSQITQTIQRNTDEQIRAVELGSERQMQIFQQLIDRRLTMESAANALHGTLSTEAQDNISVAQLRGMLEQSDRLVKQEAEDEVTVREQAATSKNKVDETSLKAFARYTDEQLKLAEKLNTERVKLAESAAKQILDIEEGLQRSIKTLRESQAAVGQPVAFANQPRDVTVPEADANRRAIEAAQQTIPAFTAAQEQINEVRSRLGAEATAESNRQNKAQLASITESTQENLALVNKAVSDKLKAKQNGDRAALKDAQDAALAENKILDEAAVAQVELQMRSTAKLIEIGDNLTEARQRQAKLQAEVSQRLPMGQPVAVPNTEAIEVSLKAEQEQIAKLQAERAELEQKAAQQELSITQTLEEQKSALRQQGLEAEQQRLNAEVESQKRADQQKLESTQNTVEAQRLALRQFQEEVTRLLTARTGVVPENFVQEKIHPGGLEEDAFKRGSTPQALVDNIVSNSRFVTPVEEPERKPIEQQPLELPVPQVEPVKEATQQIEQTVRTSAENVTRTVSEQNAAQLADTRRIQEQEQALVQQTEKRIIQLREETAKRKKEIDEELASRNQRQSELQTQLVSPPQAQLVPPPVLQGRDPSIQERAGAQDLQKASADEMAALTAAQLAVEEVNRTSQSQMTADELQQAKKRLDITEQELAGKVKARQNAEVALASARKSGEEAELRSAAGKAQTDDKQRQKDIEAEQELAAQRLKVRESLAKQITQVEQQRAQATQRIAEEEKNVYAQVEVGDRRRDATTAEVQVRNAQLQALRSFVVQATEALNQLQAVDVRVQQNITEEDLQQYSKRTSALEKSLNAQVRAVEQTGEQMAKATQRANQQMVSEAQVAARQQEEARAGTSVKSIGREALEGLVGGTERANQVLGGTLGLTSGIAGNIARMTVSMGGWILAWKAAQVVIDGVVHLLEFIPKHLEAGFQALAQDQEKAVELQAVIAQTTHLADGFVPNFRAAGQASTEVVDKLREKAAELSLDFDKLVTTFKVLSEAGAPGLTHNLQEVVDLSGLILLSFKAVTRSQEDERKIAQEIPALLSGQVQENARVLELLHMTRDEWLQTLNHIRDARDLLPFMQDRLAEFAAAAKEMPDTWISLQRQFALFERTVNEDLARPLFQQLVALAQDFNRWLSENREVIRQYASLIGQAVGELFQLVGALLQVVTGTTNAKDALILIVRITAEWLGEVNMTLASLVMTAKVLSAIASGDFSKIGEAWQEYDQKVRNTSESLAKIRDMQGTMNTGVGSVSLDAKNGSEALDKLSQKFDEVRERAALARNTLVAADAAHGKSREATAADVSKSYDEEIKKVQELAAAAKDAVEQDTSKSPEEKATGVEAVLKQRGDAEAAIRQEHFSREETAKRSHLMTEEQIVSEHIAAIQNKYKQQYAVLATDQAASGEQRTASEKRVHDKELQELNDYAVQLRAQAQQLESQRGSVLMQALQTVNPAIASAFDKTGLTQNLEAQTQKAAKLRTLANQIQADEEDILKRDTAGSATQARESATTFLNAEHFAEQVQGIATNTKTKVDDIKLAVAAGVESQVRGIGEVIKAYRDEIKTLEDLRKVENTKVDNEKNLSDDEKKTAKGKIKLELDRQENTAKAGILAEQRTANREHISEIEGDTREHVSRIKTLYEQMANDVKQAEANHTISVATATQERQQIYLLEASAISTTVQGAIEKLNRLGSEGRKAAQALRVELEDIHREANRRVETEGAANARAELATTKAKLSGLASLEIEKRRDMAQQDRLLEQQGLISKRQAFESETAAARTSLLEQLRLAKEEQTAAGATEEDKAKAAAKVALVNEQLNAQLRNETQERIALIRQELQAREEFEGKMHQLAQEERATQLEMAVAVRSTGKERLAVELEILRMRQANISMAIAEKQAELQRVLALGNETEAARKLLIELKQLRNEQLVIGLSQVRAAQGNQQGGVPTRQEKQVVQEHVTEGEAELKSLTAQYVQALQQLQQGQAGAAEKATALATELAQAKDNLAAWEDELQRSKTSLTNLAKDADQALTGGNITNAINDFGKGDTKAGVEDIGQAVSVGIKTIGQAINQFQQAKAQGGTMAGVGSLLSEGPTGKALGAIPIAGPIINAVGAGLELIGDMFSKKARQIADSINKELSNIDFQFSLTGNLSQYIQSLEAEKEKAIQELSGTKGGQKQLEKILDTLNRQLAQAINQAQQLKQEFDRGYLSLRTHNQELGQFITQMYSIFEQANKALDAGESKAKVQQFVNLSILQLKLQAQDEFLKGEQTAIEDAIKLNDLQQQRIQLIQQEKMSEFDLLTKDAVQRQIPEAIKVGQELAQKRLDFQKQLTDINNQIQLTQDKVNAEKTIYNITSDISTLHRQDEELQRYFLNEEVQKLSTAKALMEGIVTDAKGNITLSPLLDQLLGIFGFGLGGKNAGVLKGRYGFGYNPTTNPNTIGYPQQPVYSDLIPPGTPGVPTQKPLPNTLSYPITYPYAPGVQPITTQSVQTAVTQGTTAGIQQAPQFTQLRNGLQGTTAATGNLSTHTIALTGVVRELNTTLLGMTLRARLSAPAAASASVPFTPGAEISPAVLQHVTNLTNALHTLSTTQTHVAAPIAIAPATARVDISPAALQQITNLTNALRTSSTGQTPAAPSVALSSAANKVELSPVVLQQIRSLTSAIQTSGTAHTEAYRKLTSCIDQLTVAVNNLKLVNPLQIPRVQTPLVTSQQMMKSVTINGGINVSAHTNASPHTIAATVADELYRNLRYGSSF